MPNLDRLERELRDSGFALSRRDAFTIDILGDEGEETALTAQDMDGWIHVRYFIGIASNDPAFARSLLLINDRAMGFRLSLDAEGNCWALADFLAIGFSPEDAVTVIENILNTVPYYWPALSRAAEFGVGLDDNELDAIASAIGGATN